MKGLALAVFALLLAGTRASADDRGFDTPATPDNVKFAWADVLRIDPIYDRVRVENPREECDEVPVEHVDHGNKAAGTVLGAVIGGVLGSTVGKGDGRRAATVAGAVAGGAVGNHVAQGDTYYRYSERDCSVVQDAAVERRVVAYDVQYRYRGDVFMSRLTYDPGDRLRVRVSIEPAE